MLAVLIFPSGSQFPIDAEGVENLARADGLKFRSSNGSQMQYDAEAPESGEPYSVVIPCHAESYRIAVADGNRRRKETYQPI